MIDELGLVERSAAFELELAGDRPSLEEACEAHQYIEDRNRSGKIVLTP